MSLQQTLGSYQNYSLGGGILSYMGLQNSPEPSAPTASVSAQRITYNHLEVSQQGTTPSRITEVSRHILGGNAAKLFKIAGHCSASLAASRDSYHAMGDCINYIEGTFFQECSCPEFDRIRNPKLREDYENAVINKAFEKIQNQEDPKNFVLNISIFASGFLGSEAILMTRLLKAIEDHGCRGNIVLNFIDPEYEDLINQQQLASYNMTTRSQLHGQSFNDLLSLMSINSQNTKITSRIFKDGTDYTRTCHYQNHPDLLIGSDFGGQTNFNAAGQLYDNLKILNPSLDRVFLHWQDGPMFFGDQLNFQPKKSPKDNHDGLFKILGGLALMGVTSYAFYRLTKRKRRRRIEAAHP